MYSGKIYAQIAVIVNRVLGFADLIYFPSLKSYASKAQYVLDTRCFHKSNAA